MVISLSKDAGIGLCELVGPGLDDVSPVSREATVTGRAANSEPCGSSTTPPALDRYSCERAKHSIARVLSTVDRRARQADDGHWRLPDARAARPGSRRRGHPHKVRHIFSHNWLDKGGAEGDLMELNGWSSPQMLGYGRSAQCTSTPSLRRRHGRLTRPTAKGGEATWPRTSTGASRRKSRGPARGTGSRQEARHRGAPMKTLYAVKCLPPHGTGLGLPGLRPLGADLLIFVRVSCRSQRDVMIPKDDRPSFPQGFRPSRVHIVAVR